MAAAVGQFGSLYVEKGDDGEWRVLHSVIVSIDANGITVMGLTPLEPEVEITEERVYLSRAEYSESAPTSGDRIFVPLV